MLEHLERVLRRLGLRGHLHTFRHSFISHALTQGVPEAIVRLWVGRVDREVIKLYTHIADEALIQQRRGQDSNLRTRLPQSPI